MAKCFVRISTDILLKWCDYAIVNESSVIDCVDVDHIVINENTWFHLSLITLGFLVHVTNLGIF